MADNTISSNLQENIVVGATEALSESMALLAGVQMDAIPDPGNKGQSFNVGEYEDKSASDVTASNVSPDAAASTFGVKTITLDTHKKANFKLKGTEFQGNNLDATFMSQVQEIVRACVYTMNASLMAQYYKIPHYAGNAARSIFNDGSSASVDPLADLGKVLDDNRVPTINRQMFVSPTENSNAKKVPELQQANTFGRDNVIYNGFVGRTMGFDLFMDQQIPTHTTGTLTGDPDVTAEAAAGGLTVGITTDSGDAVALKQGDLVTFSGDTSIIYSAQADLSISASGTGTLTLDRPIETTIAADETIALATGHGTGTIGIAGDMTGFGLVNRIEATDYYGTGTLENRMIVTHPSGVSLSLGTYRQYKQSLFECSCLFGTQIVDSRKLVRALGA